jgi:hypothetical protein
MKLQFAMLFGRFFAQRASWRESDYLDYLHCSEMAYADAVVTERGLAARFREAEYHSPGIAPGEVYTVEWLR